MLLFWPRKLWMGQFGQTPKIVVVSINNMAKNLTRKLLEIVT